VEFLDGVITKLKSELCIDPARVFSTGLSAGGLMSSTLACTIPDQIAAIAPVAGMHFSDECSAAPPKPVMAFHGTADRILPFSGAEDSAKLWSEHNACGQRSRERVADSVELERYSECSAGTAVRFYIIQNGGHIWPGGTIELSLPPFGPANDEINATDLIWEFFKEHPRDS
jgi:polyhydroxybutyrate depolymerase